MRMSKTTSDRIPRQARNNARPDVCPVANSNEIQSSLKDQASRGMRSDFMPVNFKMRKTLHRAMQHRAADDDYKLWEVFGAAVAAWLDPNRNFRWRAAHLELPDNELPVLVALSNGTVREAFYTDRGWILEGSGEYLDTQSTPTMAVEWWTEMPKAPPVTTQPATPQCSQ
jgi:hypothetical protein